MYFYIVYGSGRRRYGGAGRNSLNHITHSSILQLGYFFLHSIKLLSTSHKFLERLFYSFLNDFWIIFSESFPK